jgi:mRNA-degrading endonuclease RelE of RelBE toxin-antitoxin system
VNYSIIPTTVFKKEAKRLSKKYPSLRDDLASIDKILGIAPDYGIKIRESVFKIRIAIKSKGKGKSGGARIVTYLINEKKEIYLLTIYDKSEYEVLSDREIDRIIQSIE